MSQEKVLIVENDSKSRELLAAFVAKEGFDVVEAKDVVGAIEKIDAERPAIILSEYKLPHGDGLQVVRHAKRMAPFSEAILITAHDDMDGVILALREGVFDYLKKPLDLKVLATVLGRAREDIAASRKNSLFPLILIVEDDEDTRKLFRHVMEKESWHVLEAKNGEEALGFFAERKIDMVIMDLKIPDKDGLTILREMRAKNPDFETIVVTGYGDERSVREALEAGAINFLKKPVDINQLAPIVQKALTELNLKRALKYRSRELELTQDILAHIVTIEGLVIDFPMPSKGVSSSHIFPILDLLPMGLILLDGKKKIHYVNKPIALAAEGQAQELNESFLLKLEKVGIRELRYDELMFRIDSMMAAHEGGFEMIRIGQWAYILLIKLIVTKSGKHENCILLVTRGERKG